MSAAIAGDTGREARSIAARLAALAADATGGWSITFLDSVGAVAERRSAPALAARTARVAAFLEQASAPGDPLLLVFHPCVDFLVAFLACQWSGRLAVPINPPRRHRLIERLQGVAADCGARLALTGGGVAESVGRWRADSPVLGALRWQDLDALADGPDVIGPDAGTAALAAPLRDVDPDAICFLQYTSGSTALPKGVEVSHRNLIADLVRMEAVWAISPASTMVTWLPAFHDLGLIFGLLQPLFSGCPVVQMAPNSFLQRPSLWLEAITRFRGTHTAAPSFAYDLCNRRITPDQRNGLDLSSLTMAMNAAEPIDPGVVESFVATFGPHGFRREAFAPAYGLAESTLAVTASPTGATPRMFGLDPAALEQGRIVEAEPSAPKRRLVAGCGAPLADVPVAIVDPETRRRLPPDRVGEIWVGGPTIARGYWRRSEETAATFGIRIAGEGDRDGYLRTGDLGALIGDELCVTGRIKDLIIVNGANHYPQDIERVAQAAHPALRVGNGAAFSVSDPHGAEQVVLIQELERTQRRADPAPLFSAISTAVWQELELRLARIVLVEPGAVLRTSSGKIQRSANCRAWRDGKLPVVAEWQPGTNQRLDTAPAPAPAPPDVAADDRMAIAADDRAALRPWLRTWLADRLGLPAGDLALDRGFGELGLSSIDAVELAAALGRRCGRTLPQTFAFDCPTVEAIVVELCGPAHASDSPVAAMAAERPARPRGDGAAEAAAVAIVGLSARVAGAASAVDFAAMLFCAGTGVRPAPADRPDAAGLPPAGYVDGVDRFDAGFFGLRPDEADAMDPQHRLALMLAWHALEDAGYADPARRPRRTGIFLGLGANDYETRFRLDEALSPSTILGNAGSVAAGRIAHWLDVTGPALVIDTACSSSLVAVHAACRALRTGECDLALAGGVNLVLDPAVTDALAAAGMLGPGHACRTFDAAADGYVRGEGGALVVLERLADAEHRRDRIRAVLRGSAVNHDGRASALTAPSRTAQHAVVTAALADAGLDPADVQAVECHGTGTPLGDPIEVHALADAYGPGRTAPLLIGSVKTNIGHLEAAAGIAGLVKTVLALEAGRLPATLHQSRPNPRIAWDDLPVRVVAETTDWPSGARRRAGVSSFGFSGTNAHVIVEAAPEQAVRCADLDDPADRTGGVLPCILPLSAHDQDGLRRLAAALVDHMSAHPEIGLASVATALAVGRGRFRHRGAVLARRRDEAIDGLQAIADGGEPAAGAIGTTLPERPRVAFLFSGQGSQWPGMAADYHAADPAFRAAVDSAGRRLGIDLPGLMTDPAAGDRLTDTAHAQPALFLLEHALAVRLAACGVRPDILAGHSLGEWSAACIAGMVSFDDALDAVATRGRLMGALPRTGAMAAVFAPPERVAPLVERHRPHLDIAAVNAPDETVVSGDHTAVEALCAELSAAGIGVQTLRTSHAFHSHLMDPAVAPFVSAVGRLPLGPPRVPVVSNVTATTEAAFTDPAYWGRQIRAPVRFADSLQAIAAHGATIVVEIGPAASLLTLAQRAPGFAGKDTRFVPTMRRNRAATETMALALCRLFVAGLDIAWPTLAPASARASLPGYPFADERHWIAAVPRAGRSRPEPRIAVAAPASTSFAAPAHPLAEAEVRAAVVAGLKRSLQLDDAAVTSDTGFFALGVDSLALTEALASIERRWRIGIPRRELFENLGTPRALVDRVVREALAKAAADPTAPAPGQSTALPSALRPHPIVPPQPEPTPPPQALDERARGLVADFAARYVARSAASRRQREHFGGVLADARAVAGFRPDTKSMLYPIIGVKGAGSHVGDADGNDYVDLTMGFGVQLLGHNHPVVVEAIGRQLAEQGLFLGPQADKAGEAAALIARVTGNERVVFCNTGTEAVMTALRLARHATGRSRVAMFAGSYHGHFDGTLARTGPDGVGAPLAGGTPPGMLHDVIVLDYADPQASQAALEAVAGDLAAVIVEPVQSRRPGLQPRDFLQWLRDFTTRAGIALIFDEVLLGFRVALGGAQAWAGVRADIVTYGKIVGGGLPIGVVAGRRTFLDGIDGGVWPLDGAGGPAMERTFFAGTFNKNPLTMAAAVAVLRHLEAEGPALQERLNARTAAFCRRLDTALAAEGHALRVEQFASLFRFNGGGDLFYNQLVARGVYVWEGRTCFLSTAHTDADLDHVAAAVLDSARALREAGLMRSADRPASGAPAGPSPGPSDITVATSPGQQALWVLAAFSPESAAGYNQSLVLRLPGVPDAAAMGAALADLIARHESLRMGFADGGAEATIAPAAVATLEEVSLPDAGAAAAWVSDAATRPFDLAHPPLLRAALLRVGGDRADIVLIQPHIATDGWSMQVLADELAKLYVGRLAGVPADLPTPVPYRRFADAARAVATDPAAEAHWRSVFATLPPVLDLPSDRPRPPLQTFAGGQVRHRVPAALATALGEQVRANSCSLFTLCLAAYGRLLSELSGADDLAVAIFAAGQPMVGAPGLTGYCVSTVPVRLTGMSSASRADVIAITRTAMAQAMAYPAFPFASIVKACGVRRDPSRPPLASVAFNLDRVAPLAPFGDLHPTVSVNAHGNVRWDLAFNLQAEQDGITIEANFNSDLFDPVRVERWVVRYRDILEEVAGLVASWPARPPGAAGARTIADLVAASAATRPDGAAVVDRDGPLSWCTLEQASGTLAARLAALGVGRGDRVAFCLARGAGPVVAMAATSRLGAAFVPLDPDYPAGYRLAVLADSGAKVLIVDETAGDEPMPVPAVAWSRTSVRDAAVLTPPPRDEAAASDLAYILFTSGSTGRPKGVMVSCAAIDGYAGAMLDRLALPAPAVFAIVTSFAADLGYTSVLGALASGGTLAVVDAPTASDPAALAAFVRRHPIDVMKIVPSHLAALLATPEAADLLPRRALICGGDVLGFDLVDRLRALKPGLRIFNHYGPTETTIGCTMVEVTDALPRPADGRVPIGRALDGALIDIVDAAGDPVAPGETGEIRVQGTGVALGYVGNDIAGRSGFRTGPDRRAYLTGDLGRMTDDGLVHFLGRKDDMVKIRGHRVDPNGVATAIRACPGVGDAAVLVDRNDDGSARLVAAAVAPGHTTDSLGALIAERLPPAQRPAVLAIVAALPLTANGKVDRAALLGLLAPAQRRSAASPTGAAAPSTRTDAGLGPLATLLALWQELFGAPGGSAEVIGPDDDFFALGGDSIMAIRLAGKARAAGWLVSPAQIFTCPTPSALAAVVQPVPGAAAADRAPLADPVPLTPIQRWFMAIGMPHRGRWALTAVFELPDGAHEDAVRGALSGAVRRHDALRTRLLAEEPPRQQAAPGDAEPVFEVVVLDEAADLHAEENAMADRLVARLDPEAGVACGAGMIVAGAARRIVLAVHHLVFDVVSWGILADDLAAVLASPPRPVPAPATAWTWWCRHQADAAVAFAAERPYWQQVEARGSAAVPLDRAAVPDLEGGAWSREDRFDRELAAPLLGGLFDRFGLQPHEAVLALVAKPLFAWAGGPVTIDLEGHGREAPDPAIDLSRTIGWFTTRHPVALPTATTADPKGWLIAVKEALRAVPRRGMGHGVLRHVGGLGSGSRPQVSFNFVGDLGRFGHHGLKLLRLGAGRERDPRAERPHRLAFNAWLDDGALVVRCEFGAGHEAATGDRLLEAIRSEATAFRALAAASESLYSPSDFSGIDMSQDELDALVADLGG
ncbi:non-ribosomal peptide synthetase/type I polyketide synthase [Rhodoplanes roseus]|nr:non-ribosomal peptide synthetase/type I polyketide synthase [Rhodoplanes roseus]